MAAFSFLVLFTVYAFISDCLALPKHRSHPGLQHHEAAHGRRWNPAGCYEGRYWGGPLEQCEGVDENSCHAQGCCWRSVYEDSDQLRCFFPPLSEQKKSRSGAVECEVETDDKVWCGFNDEVTCLDNDCCWEDEPGSPYCFEKLGNEIPEECVVLSDDKVACTSQSETDCVTEGCCWEDDPGYPYCFEKRDDAATPPATTDPAATTTLAASTTSPPGGSTVATTAGATPPPGDVCGVANEDKVSCVVTSVSQTECEAYGCCWQQDNAVSPAYWCYENNVNRPPFYDLGLTGDFTSVSGEDFTASCIYSLTQEMTDNANDMISKVNDRIGNELCSERTFDDVLVASAEVFLSAVGTQGTSSTSFSLRIGLDQMILDVEACALEIFNYTRDMSNWNQPILPPIAGCASAEFVGNHFNSSGNVWNCDLELLSLSSNTGGESRLVGYSTTLSGNAETVDNSDLSSDCADGYSEDLTSKANDLIPQVNDAIGTTLCVEYPGVQLVSAAGTLVADGSQAVTTTTFYMRPELSMYFYDIVDCAHEISLYLEDHDVWGDPILPGRAGCPDLDFVGDQFYTEIEDWACF